MSSSSLSCIQPDSDISGVGVRISFYCQVFLYVVLARFRDSAVTDEEGEEKKEDASSALSTLIITNVAMQITAFITSSKKEISLPEGLVVIYLLAMSSPCILLSLPAPRAAQSTERQTQDPVYTKVDIEEQECVGNRLNDNMDNEQKRSRKFENLLHIFAVLQSYSFSAYNLYLVFTANSFGVNPECNSKANLALFACIPAEGLGLVVAQVVAVLVIVIKTAFFLNDFRSTKKIQRLAVRQTKLLPGYGYFERAVGHTPSLRYRNTIKAGFILLVWMLAVVNTEFLISCNNLGGHGSSQWDFGQILPMLLLVDPIYDVAKNVWDLPRMKRYAHKLRKLFG